MVDDRESKRKALLTRYVIDENAGDLFSIKFSIIQYRNDVIIIFYYPSLCHHRNVFA